MKVRLSVMNGELVLDILERILTREISRIYRTVANYMSSRLSHSLRKSFPSI